MRPLPALNQMTTKRWTLPEAVAGCVRHGLEAIGVWREPLADVGVRAARMLIDDAGLRVSSLCRGGFLTAADPDAAAAALADNRRAIDEAAALDAACLVFVVGGLPAGSRDLAGARERVADAVAALVPHAAASGVRIALEPLHPMYCADRAVLSTLRQALDLADRFPAETVGVAVDTFHLWWDPDVFDQIDRAGSRIFSYQVCDWLVPLPADVLLGRAMPGDGPIEFAPITAAVRDAGYTGDVEVEIFNQQVWDADPDDVVRTMLERCAPILAAPAPAR